MTMQPRTWDRAFYAQRAQRPLAATAIMSGKLFGIIPPPLAPTTLSELILRSAEAWIEKPFLRPGERRRPT